MSEALAAYWFIEQALVFVGGRLAGQYLDSLRQDLAEALLAETQAWFERDVDQELKLALGVTPPRPVVETSSPTPAGAFGLDDLLSLVSWSRWRERLEAWWRSRAAHNRPNAQVERRMADRLDTLSVRLSRLCLHDGRIQAELVTAGALEQERANHVLVAGQQEILSTLQAWKQAWDEGRSDFEHALDYVEQRLHLPEGHVEPRISPTQMPNLVKSRWDQVALVCLAAGARVVLEGDAGAGKSTFLDWLERVSAKPGRGALRRQAIRIKLKFRFTPKSVTPTSPLHDIAEWLQADFARLEARARRSRLVFLVDGLNEIDTIEQQERAVDWVAYLSAKQVRNSPVIVTTRGLPEVMAAPLMEHQSWSRWTLRELALDGVKSYLERRLGFSEQSEKRELEEQLARWQSDPALWGLVSNPLWLSLVADASLEDGRRTLRFARVGELCRSYVRKLITKTRTPHGRSPREVLRDLYRLAIGGSPPRTVEDKQALLDTGVVQAQEGGGVDFVHDLIRQGVFAAAAVDPTGWSAPSPGAGESGDLTDTRTSIPTHWPDRFELYRRRNLAGYRDAPLLWSDLAPPWQLVDFVALCLESPRELDAGLGVGMMMHAWERIGRADRISLLKHLVAAPVLRRPVRFEADVKDGSFLLAPQLALPDLQFRWTEHVMPHLLPGVAKARYEAAVNGLSFIAHLSRWIAEGGLDWSTLDACRNANDALPDVFWLPFVQRPPADPVILRDWLASCPRRLPPAVPIIAMANWFASVESAGYPARAVHDIGEDATAGLIITLAGLLRLSSTNAASARFSMILPAIEASVATTPRGRIRKLIPQRTRKILHNLFDEPVWDVIDPNKRREPVVAMVRDAP